MERYYETIFILRPTLNDQEISEAIDNYKDLLVRHGADMFKQEDLGKKKLAYLIKKFQNGHYALYQYKAEATAVAELERSFKISEDVLRYLTVKLDEKNPPTRAPEESDDTEAESGDTPVAAGDSPAVSADAPAVSGDAPKEEEA